MNAHYRQELKSFNLPLRLLKKPTLSSVSYTHLQQQSSGLPKSVVFKNLNINVQNITLKPKGRTKTLPADIALHALGESIHYMLTYGDELVDFAIKVKREILKSNVTNSANLCYLTKNSTKHVPTLLNVPNILDALNINQLGSIYSSYSLEKFNKAGGSARAETIRPVSYTHLDVYKRQVY